MRQTILKEALEYFRARPVYEKLFQLVMEKYRILGRLGGIFVLSGLSLQEKQDLGGFFQKDYLDKKVVKIPMQTMEKALSQSRFSDLTWEEILTAYMGQALVWEKEVRRTQLREKEAFFQEILENAPREGASWLRRILKEQTGGYQIVIQNYNENPQKLRKLLEEVLRGISQLPMHTAKGKEEELKRERLPVFAARITGNPHFFDEGKEGGRLLLSYLRSVIPVSGESASLFRNEEKNALLYQAGILRDDLSNDTLVYGIRAVAKDGCIHEGIEGFRERKEPLKLTLSTLSGLAAVICAFENSKVYVVENPAIFSTLIEEHPEITAICSNGQPRLATLVLMDFLESTATFYYSGDFDPEGLQIAQRLKKRYRRLQFWNYERKQYEAALSEEKLDEVRLAKLRQITDPDLLEIRDAILETRKAGYQENLLR